MELRDITSIEVNYSNKEKRKILWKNGIEGYNFYRSNYSNKEKRKKKKKNFAKSYPKVKLEHIPIKCSFDPILIVR